MNETKEKRQDDRVDKRAQQALDALDDLPFKTALTDLDTTAEHRAFAKVDVEDFFPEHFRGEVRSAHFEQIGERNLIRLRVNVYTGQDDGPDARWDTMTYEARFVDGQWSDFVAVD